MNADALPPAAARRTIRHTFEALRAQKRLAVIPFIPAGYPDIATTAAALPALQAGGASLIEIGFPFSDPVADGPVIQEAFSAALAAKIRVADVFAAVASVRDQVSIPLLGMLSYSIVYRYGLARFIADARGAGFDGLILPDLPPPEAQAVCDIVRGGGLETILLIAPTTTPARRAQIARLSSGFVYYLSLSGITGERAQLPPDLAENVRAVKALTDTPVCVGFGISKPEHVARLEGVADGVIVGSALVSRMKQLAGADQKTLTDAMASFVASLVPNVG